MRLRRCRNGIDDGVRQTEMWNHRDHCWIWAPLKWLVSKPKADLEAVGFQIREHDLITSCRVRGQGQPMTCSGLQIDGDVGCSWIKGADVPQVVDVVAVAIAGGIVIFTNEDLQI